MEQGACSWPGTMAPVSVPRVSARVYSLCAPHSLYVGSIGSFLSRSLGDSRNLPGKVGIPSEGPRREPCIVVRKLTAWVRMVFLTQQLCNVGQVVGTLCASISHL